MPRRLVVNFGPPPDAFDISNSPTIFVIAAEGHGTVAVKSAEQERDFIQFNFDGRCAPDKAACCSASPRRTAVASEAILFGFGSPPVSQTTAQAPRADALLRRGAICHSPAHDQAIITGATGMVGEGVLLECLANPAVEQVLVINASRGVAHAKLREIIHADFFDLARSSRNSPL